MRGPATPPVDAEVLHQRLTGLVGPDRPARATTPGEDDDWPPDPVHDQPRRASTARLPEPTPAEPGHDGAGPDRAGQDRAGHDWAGGDRTVASRTWSAQALVVLVAVLVVAGIVAGVVFVRSRPVAVTESSTVEVTGLPSPSAPAQDSSPVAPQPAVEGGQAAAPAPASQAPIEVHVIGAVRQPGVVTLTPDARVHQAIEEAGGLKDSADTGDLNLAQPIEDGAQLRIGTSGNPGGEISAGPPAGDPGAATTPASGTGAGAAAGSGASGGLVNLNQADAATLETLPGVGPATSAKIISYREQHGGFTSVEQLEEVSGIGPKTYAELAPLVTV